ncbi:MAG: endonuclease/exonuclease/phosphatase family protein [Sedimentisphaerales bacterium]|nr:endonuclease/exonuclease/phosphatase family protein [Sedimentisphaerales bacterium]
MSESQANSDISSLPVRRRLWRKMLLILLLVLVLLGGLLLWACGGIQTARRFEGEIRDFYPAQTAVSPTDALTVMTWNIAWAYGAGSEGTGYEPRSREEMLERVEAIGEVIRDNKVDVVLLQEVDFDSSRSGRMDQLAELARVSGLRYGAYALSWKANYVPFPYWPPRRHFGRMRSGGAVLSRFPITNNIVFLHSKPDANSRIYNLFYLFRYMQRVSITIGDRKIQVVNNHLEAFDRTNRQQQAITAVNLLEQDALCIFGGDFNALPPEARQGHSRDDYGGDNTIEKLRDVPYLHDVTDLDDYQNNYDAWRTFPADKPELKLDYLFVSDGFTVESAQVIPADQWSDHLPIVCVISRK